MNIKLIEGTNAPESLEELEKLIEGFAPIYRESMRHLIAATWNLLANQVNTHTEMQREGGKSGRDRPYDITPM